MQLLKNLSAKHILILILLFTAFLRLYRIDYPNKYIFDEVYHAFTAKEYLAGHKEAWEWWATPPPGVAYEWTHPPLAKEIMAVSMFVLNTEDSWAYRLPGALLGVLSVYLVYLLGIKFLNNRNAALIASFVFSLDGLNFVQSRIGMNDIYYVTFILISLLFFLKRRLLLSAILFGLAFSSKWAAIYIIIIYLAILLKDKSYKQILYFILIPPIIYLISYTPFFLLGHSFDQFIGLQQQMWWYHTGLKATHAYSSPAWTWPLNLYPVWYFVDYQKNTIANIFASGNPALFWIGSISLIITAVESFRKRSFNLLLVVLFALIFWLPWSVSPRIMFLYHFSPSVPFLGLALGHQLSSILKEKQGRKLAIVILLLITLSFGLIFPFITGIHVPRPFVKIFFMTNHSKNIF